MNDLEIFTENARILANLATKIDSFEKLGEFASAAFVTTSIELFNTISKATGSKNRAIMDFTGFSHLTLPFPFDIISIDEKEENKES